MCLTNTLFKCPGYAFYMWSKALINMIYTLTTTFTDILAHLFYYTPIDPK